MLRGAEKVASSVPQSVTVIKEQALADLTTGTAAPEAGIVQRIDGERRYDEPCRQGSRFVEPDLLKRVEVLRGLESSTLHGAGALGGVIAMGMIDADDRIAPGADSGGRVRLGHASNPGTGFGSLAWVGAPMPGP